MHIFGPTSLYRVKRNDYNENYMYYIRHKAETHENRRFFSTGMEFQENTYAYVLKAPSRSNRTSFSSLGLTVQIITSMTLFAM